MKKAISKTLAAFLIAACLAAAPAAGAYGNISASANSAPAYWYGSDGTGVVPAEENCPVEVEREHLTLEIPTLPQASYSSQEEFDAYNARFTAEYTFYNPTDETLTVELAFPFGTAPEYLRYSQSDTDEETKIDDSARYGVTVEGEEAETELRYTYFTSELALPAKEKTAGRIFREDADLYEFSYAASAGVDLGNGNYYLELRLSFSTARTCILCDNYRDYFLEDGDLVLLLYLNEDPVRFFSVGEKPQIKYTKVAKQGNGLANGKRTYVEDANIQMSEKCSMFGTWVGDNCPQGIGETDWYNAIVAHLERMKNPHYGLSFSDPSSLFEKDLMRWFIYTLEIPAKGSVKNAVTGPLYPDVTQSSFRYRYLLSPAQNWAKFGEFSITVTTPYTLEGCDLSLEKTDGGYSYSRDGLPLGELEFTIYGSGKGFTRPSSQPIFLLIVPIILLAVTAVAGIVVGITLAVVFGVRARKRRKARGGGKTS